VSYDAGGAAVLKLAQPYASTMINAFNQIGLPKPPPTTTTTAPTTTSTVPHSQVDVQVLNASSVAGIAHTTATALSAQGFTVAEVGNATTPLAAGVPSQIHYGPNGYAAAITLGTELTGSVTYALDPSLTGQTLTLLIAGSDLGVKGSSSTTTTTTTTAPSAGSTTTTIPSDVYTNTQAEPWNPFPCTLGAAPPTTSTSSTTSTGG
jgi:hypothetical protein